MEAKCHEQVSAREALADRTNSKVQMRGMCPVTSNIPTSTPRRLRSIMLVHQLFRTAIHKWPTSQSQQAAWQLTSMIFCDDALHSCTQIKRMPRFTFNGCQQYQLCAVCHASNFCHNCKDDKAVPFRYEHTTGELAISARRRTTAASGCATGEGHTSIPPTHCSDGHVVRRLAGALSGETFPPAFTSRSQVKRIEIHYWQDRA